MMDFIGESKINDLFFFVCACCCAYRYMFVVDSFFLLIGFDDEKFFRCRD